MTPNAAAHLLAIACTYDQRLKPPTAEDARARSVAWAAALHPTMTPEWAEKAIVDHYARRTDQIMPAHLNDAHRAYRDRQRSINQSRALQHSTGVPMPASVRDALTKAVTRG